MIQIVCDESPDSLKLRFWMDVEGMSYETTNVSEIEDCPDIILPFAIVNGNIIEGSAAEIFTTLLSETV